MFGLCTCLCYLFTIHNYVSSAPEPHCIMTIEINNSKNLIRLVTGSKGKVTGV